jgi:uncharacterized paraquat-inducible protein A
MTNFSLNDLENVIHSIHKYDGNPNTRATFCDSCKKVIIIECLIQNKKEEECPFCKKKLRELGY